MFMFVYSDDLGQKRAENVPETTGRAQNLRSQEAAGEKVVNKYCLLEEGRLV